MIFHYLICLTMLSPNTKTFLIILVFVFLLVFLISSLLGLSVDTTTFGDPPCQLFWELIVGNLSQEFFCQFVPQFVQLRCSRFCWENSILNFHSTIHELELQLNASIELRISLFLVFIFNIDTVSNWLMVFIQCPFCNNYLKEEGFWYLYFDI